MAVAERWTCRVCWKPNWLEDERCARCKSPRELDREQVEEQRKVVAARAEQPEVVPDIVVALPVVIFRGYSRAWKRGGLGTFGFLALMAFAGVTEPGWLIVTAGLAAGLLVFGFVAGEVADAMREREVWAFLVGIGLSVVAIVGSVTAFQVLAPGMLDPNAIRWGSVIVFGGAGLAAFAGLVLLFTGRRRAT
jgi:hypothetical protein